MFQCLVLALSNDEVHDLRQTILPLSTSVSPGMKGGYIFDPVLFAEMTEVRRIDTQRAFETLVVGA